MGIETRPPTTHLGRLLQHSGVLRNEADVQAAAMHLQGTVGVREGGIGDNGYAMARVEAVVQHLLGDLLRVRRVGHVEGAVDATTAAERGRRELVLVVNSGRCGSSAVAVVVVLEGIVTRLAAGRRGVVRIEGQVGILQETAPELGLHVVLGPLDEQQLGQDLDEDAVHPGRHSVGLR